MHIRFGEFPGTMKLKLSQFIFLIVCCLGTWQVNAQPFFEEIAAFKRADSISFPFPGKHPIVFAGSSSFRMWKDLAADFPDRMVLNRGFGGATLPDVIRYTPEVIIKYSPAQVVIYCGENDIASDDHPGARTVLKRFRELFNLIRGELPAARISFVSMKPSPSRLNLQSRMIEANKLTRKFLRKKQNTDYIDIYSLMINPDGSIKNELFLQDMLHMNSEGYKIWQKAIEPYLVDTDKP
jgi:lysophospholipase L1-like esterase